MFTLHGIPDDLSDGCLKMPGDVHTSRPVVFLLRPLARLEGSNELSSLREVFIYNGTELWLTISSPVSVLR